MRQELREICAPVLHEVLNHPFWTGLRDGTLPATALARFVHQDTAYLLPAYARALARCAADAPDDAGARLLGQSVVGTLDARDGLRAAHAALAPGLGLPEPDSVEEPVAPAVAVHAAFFTSSAASSYHAGIGALLPMVWFNAEVSDHLRDHAVPGNRYLPWITAYHPGESYRFAVEAFAELADRLGERSTPEQRRLITTHFTLGIHHELAFADACAAPAARPAGRGAR
ncbi:MULTISPECIES: TenA family protein [Streptomyces]|jgi:thiaminase (transcriptional activator TenA)|uniref:Thiaminase/transcriptional activator TenA n=1 Tax=Streptomyces nymphaeiformis TaxID=2663842 RepID=A0A7W7UBA7_9ACTN|nr:TenA family transcriptional regulator [Streptomyces nymphaeiformis]MBB4987075.1 thiaminase/transcriptional activator TenA [Streptomyces nymphaeiformis]